LARRRSSRNRRQLVLVLSTQVVLKPKSNWSVQPKLFARCLRFRPSFRTLPQFSYASEPVKDGPQKHRAVTSAWTSSR
jgi:hypothetical protein